MKYSVEQIGSGIYKLDDFGLSTMFLIRGEEKVLAIDCGTGVGDYRSAVNELAGGLPVLLAATHAHVDHIGGRHGFDSLMLSKADEGLVKGVSVAYRKFYFYLQKLTHITTLKRSECVFDAGKEPELVFIGEGDIINLGGRTVEVFETPGHTTGSLCYLLREDRILFSGDVINEINLLFLKGASPVETVRETMLRIKNMSSFDTIWASHYPQPLSRDAIDRGIRCTEKILKSSNLPLPLIAKKTLDGFTFTYRTDRIRGK